MYLNLEALDNHGIGKYFYLNTTHKCCSIICATLPPLYTSTHYHDDVIKWKHCPRNWPFVRGIHRSPVNSPHKGQWRGALMFSLIWAWINVWVNNGEAGGLRRHRAHSLHWRHNEPDGVSNHQPRDCLLNCLFKYRSKKTSKLRVTGLCVENSPGPVNSPHKRPVTRKMFSFDDVIMLWRHRIVMSLSKCIELCISRILLTICALLFCVGVNKLHRSFPNW